MYPILQAEALNTEVTRMVVAAPDIAAKILPGQFVMLRIDESGERIPLTVSSADAFAGTITIIFQAVGATTMRMAAMHAGDAFLDVCGPLGKPTELNGVKRACGVCLFLRLTVSTCVNPRLCYLFNALGRVFVGFVD